MSIFKDGLIRQGASVGTASLPYQIDQSIRFNDDDSAYLTRTQPTSTTTNKLFTISFWIKRNPGTNSIVYNGHYNSSNFNWLGFANDDTFFVQFYSGGNNIFVQTTNRKFRDPAAWYHIVYIYDSAEAVSTERTRLYVNGQRETLVQYTSNTLYPSQNGSHYWIYTGVSNNIGLRASDNLRLDAYIAELAMFQDQEYGPENFGEYNSSNIWIPKDGIADLNFGDSGFYIKGEDSSDLGNDSGTANSGSGWDFTVSGLAANDQRTDSPTNNYCVMNPLVPGSATFANGNLDLSYSASAWTTARGSIGIPYNSGIYYYEAKVISHAIYLSFGWGDVDMGANQNNNPATPKFFVYGDYNGKYYSSTDDGTIGDAWDNNDVIGLWYDSGSTSNNLKFYRNGTLQSSGTKSFNFSDVAHVTAITQFYSSNSVEYRFDPAYWTNAPSGITESNAINSRNLGS